MSNKKDDDGMIDLVFGVATAFVFVMSIVASIKISDLQDSVKEQQRQLDALTKQLDALTTPQPKTIPITYPEMTFRITPNKYCHIPKGEARIEDDASTYFWVDKDCELQYGSVREMLSNNLSDIYPTFMVIYTQGEREYLTYSKEVKILGGDGQ